METEPRDLYRYERELNERGVKLICGIDEVGRGALAGPLVCAGVILRADNIPEGIDDSKKLTAKKREQLYDAILKAAVGYKIIFTPIEVIDKVNILNATIMTMRRVALEMEPAPEHLLIDALRLPDITIPQTGIIKGDASSVSIGAASIIAKVARDRHMTELASSFPAYKWEKNKGYGAQVHLDALMSHGVTVHHRRSFAPVSEMVSADLFG
ncbi:MAG: ribonuclease HII [Spirochaetes bacterium]|nr:ribonuclease HII [Spirochaetota bacterium]